MGRRVTAYFLHFTSSNDAHFQYEPLRGFWWGAPSTGTQIAERCMAIRVLSAGKEPLLRNDRCACAHSYCCFSTSFHSFPRPLFHSAHLPCRYSSRKVACKCSMCTLGAVLPTSIKCDEKKEEERKKRRCVQDAQRHTYVAPVPDGRQCNANAAPSIGRFFSD